MDDLDRQIVNELVLNGRASLTEIARVVAMSVPAVKRRISRLLDLRVDRAHARVAPCPRPAPAN